MCRVIVEGVDCTVDVGCMKGDSVEGVVGNTVEERGKDDANGGVEECELLLFTGE